MLLPNIVVTVQLDVPEDAGHGEDDECLPPQSGMVWPERYRQTRAAR